MNAVLKLSAVAALIAGVVVERAAWLRAPGFAIATGTLVAAYLWFLASARPHLRSRP